MYEIDITYFLYLALVIPLLVIVNYIYMLWRKKVQNSFSKHDLLEYISPNRSNFKLNLKLILECLAILCLSIALANPKIGTELKTINREGVDIVFAVDVSKSMLAEDVAPNRLLRSKNIVSEIINSLSSDRVGIVAYAAQAIPQVPLTTDFASVKNFLQIIDTDMLSSQGTSIDAALNLSVNFFDQNSETNRVLVLISDVNGEVVITKRNSLILNKIADSSDGDYIDGNFTEEALDQVKSILNEIDKSEFETSQFIDYKQQFQIFLFLSLLFIICDVFVFQTKTKWIQNLNLFNENKD